MKVTTVEVPAARFWIVMSGAMVYASGLTLDEAMRGVRDRGHRVRDGFAAFALDGIPREYSVSILGVQWSPDLDGRVPVEVARIEG